MRDTNEPKYQIRWNWHDWRVWLLGAWNVVMFLVVVLMHYHLTNGEVDAARNAILALFPIAFIGLQWAKMLKGEMYTALDQQLDGELQQLRAEFNLLKSEATLALEQKEAYQAAQQPHNQNANRTN